MQCHFEGPFTEEEKREIRAGLRALELAMELFGIRLGASWRVERVMEEESEGPAARHAERRRRSACSPSELGREIRKTATFLSRRRR